MPIKLSVNCWFCNSTNYVSFFKRNSWYCTNCEQYNGFTKDGDYNKEIPEMYQTPATTTATTKFKINNKSNNNNKQQTLKSTNCLCDKCNLNQEMKLFRLREYQNQLSKTSDDLSTSNSSISVDDVQVNLYKEYLDKIHDLCDSCKSKVKFEIRKQDGILKEYLYKLGNFKYFFENRTTNQIKNVKLPSTSISTILVNLFVLCVGVAIIVLYALDSYKLLAFPYGFTALLSAYFINAFLFASNHELIDLIISLIQYISMYFNYTNHYFVNFKYEFQLVLTQIVVCSCVLIKLLFNKKSKSVNVNVKQSTVNVHRPHPSTSFDQNYFTKSFSSTTSLNKSTRSSFSLIKPPKFNYQDDNNDYKYTSNNNSNNNNRLALALSLPAKSLFKREDESLNGNAGDGSDDDSSSIISGMTNLYLEKSNGMKSFNSFDSSISTSTLTTPREQQKNNPFYPSGINLLFIVTVVSNSFFIYHWFFNEKTVAA